MMLDPSLALQGAVYAALTNSNAVANAGVIPAQVFDYVPENPTYPFIGIGDDQIMAGTLYAYSATSDCHVNVHIYSQTKGKPQVKALAGAVRSALEGAIAINGFTVVTYEYVTTRFMTQPDGITQHAIVELEYTLAAISPLS